MLTFHRKNNFLVYHKSRARVDGRRGYYLFAVRARGYFAFTEDGHVLSVFGELFGELLATCDTLAVRATERSALKMTLKIGRRCLKLRLRLLFACSLCFLVPYWPLALAAQRSALGLNQARLKAQTFASTARRQNARNRGHSDTLRDYFGILGYYYL